MELALLLTALAVLLAINAFFVVAEFALVKVRPSRVEELAGSGDARAILLQQIIGRIDEYLAVCQVGITTTSVALGFVGERASAWMTGSGDTSALHVAFATMVSLLLVSGSHIVLGEQVPKYIAIRLADRWSLRLATSLRFCHFLFFIPLWILNRASLLVLRLFGISGATKESAHSEDELRIILDRSQGAGLISFRRLLFIENIFDLGDLKVRDAMLSRERTRCLHLGRSWEDNRKVWSESRFSRFPLIEDGHDAPVGILHVKNLLLESADGRIPDLKALARPYLSVPPDRPLEAVLAEMQRRRIHVALVFAEGRWTGFLSMEDIIEEIIGTVQDEFEVEQIVTLAECLVPGRVVLGLEASSLTAAIPQIIAAVPADDLPQPAETIVRAVLERERLASTYLGKGVAMPHARMPGLSAPVVVFASAPHGIAIDAGGRHERIHLIFMLLTPAGTPRVHQRLQARIVGVLENSEFVVDRLRDALSRDEVVEVLRTGEQAALD